MWMSVYIGFQNKSRSGTDQNGNTVKNFSFPFPIYQTQKKRQINEDA